MAQSRLEKIGTIFTRVTGLLRAKAMKPEDKPMWYDLYATFPPKLEPRYDRPAPNIPIRQIFYEEDVIRAKYHKSVKQVETINLNDTKRETQTQQFIKIYQELKAQGPLDDEQIFATALELLKERRSQFSQEAKTLDLEVEEEPLVTEKVKLLEDFAEAKAKVSEITDTERPANKKPSGRGTVKIEDLFKDS